MDSNSRISRVLRRNVGLSHVGIGVEHDGNPRRLHGRRAELDVGDRNQMIRSELIQKLADANPDLTPRDVETIVTTFFDEICERLAADGRVELRGFGAFSTRSRSARAGRNPRTGAVVAVDGKRVPYFKAGKEMRGKLNVV